jgi:thiol-disulfide isomerase/thioredoxin
MTARQQWLVVAGIVALLGGGVWAATHLLGDELTQVTVGTRAPDFAGALVVPSVLPAEAGDRPATQTVGSTADEPVTPSFPDVPLARRTMADYAGSVILLNIWATWCAPCRAEMPSIEALHRSLGPQGLKVVAISVDEPGKARDIHAFARELGLTFEILYDSLGTIQRTYRTTGVPETFVIARDGVIRKKWIGPEDWNSPANRRMLQSLLAESGR